MKLRLFDRFYDAALIQFRQMNEMKVLITILVIISIVLLPCGVSGAIWNAKSQWVQGSNPQNPDAVWTYRHGDGRLLVWKPAGQWGSPACYALSVTEDQEGLLFGQGTFGADGMDAADFGGHGPWMLRWKSPINGMVQISGYLYMTQDHNRLTTWKLLKNNIVFTDGFCKYDCNTSQSLMGPSNKIYFTEGSGGLYGNRVEVSIGDTIDLVAGPLGWGQVAGPCNPNGPQPSPQWCAGSLEISEVSAAETVNLTIVINSPTALPAGAVSPAAGTHAVPKNTMKQIGVNTLRVVDCPDVVGFTQWQGSGIVNPAVSATFVAMTQNRTITCAYADARACGDECRPIMAMDFNGDCVVDKLDLDIFTASYLNCNKPACQEKMPYPDPDLPGVDLSWHLKIGANYAGAVIDKRREGIPFYINEIYAFPAMLSHGQWDVPHVVGRLLHVMLRWEETFGQSHPDQNAIDLLRTLMFDSINETDHFAHFPAYCRPTQEVDMHSQREVLLALVDLARLRSDQQSRTLADQLVDAYIGFVNSPSYSPNPMVDGRFIEALLDYHQLTADSGAMTLLQQLGNTYYNYFDDAGTFPQPSHNHSVLGTITNMIELGLYLNQPQYITKMKKIIDNGVWNIRSKYGLVFEGIGPRGEANCTADVVRAELLLARNGYPEYFNDVERIVRNHLVASQFLNPYVTVGPAGQTIPKDTNDAVYTNAAIRACGGYAFTLPNDLVDLSYVDLAADMVEGATSGLVDTWNAVVTDQGGALKVNLLFSKVTPDIEIHSYIPAQGKVELLVKRSGNLYVRIPNYVAIGQLSVTVNGSPASKQMSGPYLYLPQLSNPSTVVVEFPQTLVLAQETIAGATYTIQWLGDTVLNIEPQGQILPLYNPARLEKYGVSSQ